MKKKILIIEDDPFLGDVLNQKLTRAEYDVTLVQDGAEGFKQINLIKPDLILLDIILPTMNGYEILEAKHKNAEIADIPVIIVSNSGQPVEINRALSLGITDYLVKAQMDPEEVLAKVKSTLEPPAAPGGRLKGRKILWVEDDSFLGDLVASKLGHEGCVALHAKDGESALDILKEEKPDIMLLDLVLPGMSGFDVLEQVRKNPDHKDMPIVVLSNLGQEKDIARCKELGAAKYLVKAEHDLDDIISEVLKILDASHA